MLVDPIHEGEAEETLLMTKATTIMGMEIVTILSRNAIVDNDL